MDMQVAGAAARARAPERGMASGDGSRSGFTGLALGAPQSGSPEPAGRRRQWTINGDFLALKPTGVARYGREVTLELDALVRDRHPLTQDLDLKIVAPGLPAVPLVLERIPVEIVPEFRMRLPQVWVQFQLPRHVSGGLVSFCNLAPIRVQRHIVCIHDLQTRTVPESYGRLFRLIHWLVLPRLGQRAQRVTTVSEKSRQDLVHYGVVPERKLVVTYNGSDHVRRWQAARAGRQWRAERPFVLCIGRNDAHKNTKLLWKLAAPLDRIGVDIALVGDIDLARLGEDGRPQPANMHLLGRVGDDDLAAALKEALCLLFPSRTEGFGLPAIEAMASGCPVIASLAPCLPEICGEAALYAGPDDVDGWIAAVQQLLNRPERREAMIVAGRAQAERYAWRNVAQTYLRLMSEIDRGRI